MDRERLFSDLRQPGSQHLQGFLQGYLDTRLDVVSLAEAKETVANAPTSQLFDERLQGQVRAVLEYVEDSLKTVPHQRREQMTLGEYLQRHSYINSLQGSQEYLNDILKRRIESLLGTSEDDTATIDWELAGVRTNPLIHEQEDTRVKSALSEGKGYSPEGTLDILIDSHLHGRAAQELGEAPQVAYFTPGAQEPTVAELPQFELEKLLRDARELTKLRPESVFTRNYFENELLSAYTSPAFDQREVESLVQRYTDIRVKECMLNEEFAKKAKSNNGHYYLKMLREQITEELNLAEKTKASDLAFHKILERERNIELPNNDV
jgi:hypothetical protein